MSATTARLDHGVLNIPGRTAGINAELDRWKAGTRAAAHAQAKADAAKTREQRAEAKALIEGLTDEQAIALASRRDICFPPLAKGGTAKQARAKLNSTAHWMPATLLQRGAAA